MELKSAIKIESKYLEALEYYGKTSLKLGDAREAFIANFRVAELVPDNIDAQLKLATFYWLGRKYQEVGNFKTAIGGIMKGQVCGSV